MRNVWSDGAPAPVGPYSQAVMSYLLDDAMPEYTHWTDYYKIMTGCWLEAVKTVGFPRGES